MMKTLLLLRHAKSSWKEAGQADHSRPLNKRGLRDAPRIGALLGTQKIEPELIVSSSAVRALLTAEAVAEALDIEIPLIKEDALYLASSSAYIQCARYVDQGVQSILMVGHNPGISDLLFTLTGCDDPMPTAALAQIEFPIDDWKELSLETQGNLVDLWRPKDLDARYG